MVSMHMGDEDTLDPGEIDPPSGEQIGDGCSRINKIPTFPDFHQYGLAVPVGGRNTVACSEKIYLHSVHSFLSVSAAMYRGCP